jgi:hypothetical protein
VPLVHGIQFHGEVSHCKEVVQDAIQKMWYQRMYSHTNRYVALLYVRNTFYGGIRLYLCILTQPPTRPRAAYWSSINTCWYLCKEATLAGLKLDEKTCTHRGMRGDTIPFSVFTQFMARVEKELPQAYLQWCEELWDNTKLR